MIMSSWPPHIPGLPYTLEDLLSRHAVALRGPLGVQEERAVDAGIPLGDRRAVHPRELRD